MPDNLSSEARMWIFLGGVTLAICLILIVLVLQGIREKKLLETVTSSNRGTKAERDLVLELLKYGISSESIFHDLYVKRYNGKFSQIDLVVTTRVGVVVFEVKDYGGWIFGSGRNSQWTQVMAYGEKKYRFYNPIKQNEGHIRSLREQMTQYVDVPFYSVVVFFGDCVLKDVKFVPDGTFLVKSDQVLKVIDFLESENGFAHNYNKIEIVRILQEAVRNGESKDIQELHIKNVEEMMSKYGFFD